MKITIDIDHQDIANATQAAFSTLFGSLQEIASSSKAEATDKDTVKPAEKPASTSKATKATKVSEPKATPAQEEAVKPTEETVKKSEPAPVEEPKKEAPAPAEEPKEEKKLDRESIVAQIKDIAFKGKAEGKPKKIKALLKEYGVDKLPDLPDEKIEEFFAKVEAL